jgi:DNA gyrase/topoisomerase IV subunit A
MNNINSKCVSELFWQGGSSRPEAAAEGRETSEVKEETYASCIVLNFSYYETPTFYNVKRIAKIVPYRDRPWILEAKTIATAFTNILFFVFKRRELCKCV